MKREKEKTKVDNTPKGFHRAVPIILLAVAVFIGICYITSGDTGMLGHAISSVFLGLFSVGAYFIPLMIAIHAIFYYSDIKEKRLLSRIIFSILTVLAISTLTHVIIGWNDAAPQFSPSEFYNDGTVLGGGGLVGGVIAFAIRSLVGRVGVIIVSAVIFVIYIVFFFSRTETLINIGRGIIYGVLTVCAFFERLFKRFIGLFKRPDKKRRQEKEKIEEFADDEFFDVDNGLSELSISELGIKETRSEESIEANPTLHEQVHHRSSADVGEGERPRRVVRESVVDDFDDYVTVDEERQGVGASDSADAVFTSDFDPYNIAMAEALANKPSSMSSGRRPAEATVSESIDEITEEEVERLRREAEFERAKARAEEDKERERLIEEARRRAYSEPPVDYSGEGKSVAFNLREEEIIDVAPSVDETISVTIEKTGEEPHHEPTYDYREVEIDEGQVRYTRDDNHPDATPKTSEETVDFEVEIHREESEFKPYSIPTDDRGQSLSFDVEDNEVEAGPVTIERTHIGSSAEEEPVSFIFDKKEEPISPTPVYEYDEDEDEKSELIEQVVEEDVPDEEIPESEQNPEILDWRRRFEMFRDEEDQPTEEPTEVSNPYTGVEEDEESSNLEFEVEDEEDDIPFEPTRVEAPTPKPPQKKASPFKNYKLPPIDLLSPPDETEEDSQEAEAEIAENISILMETLDSFGVTASIKGVDRGPRITRYEVVPAKGVRVNQITNLFNDISLALAAEGIRMEAPIPGKSAIGFEVPNKKSVIVKLRELMETSEYANSTSSTFVCVGKNVAGEPVFGDIEKYPHALVAGATNMGKSVCINSLILSMLYHAKPNELRFILIDPKKVEFKVYSGIPHLLVPVVTEAKQAAGALMWAVDEMERRYNLMEEHNAKNIKEYNALIDKDPTIGEKAARIIIVIDELNDLMMQVRNPVESLIMRLAQKARAAGIHLIIGTQRPDVKVITGTIKANIPTRISCKVTSQVDSRTILEQIGAEKLLPYGDILYKPPEKTSPLRVQGAFVSSKEVEEIVAFIKSQVEGECYDESVLNEINKAAQKCGNKKGDSVADDFDDDDGEECGYYSDQQFLDAVEVAIRMRKVSTSLLQRKLKIGFSKAARYVDAMEEIGIVSEPNGQKPRDVLISMDEWMEKLSRVNMDE